MKDSTYGEYLKKMDMEQLYKSLLPWEKWRMKQTITSTFGYQIFAATRRLNQLAADAVAIQEETIRLSTIIKQEEGIK